MKFVFALLVLLLVVPFVGASREEAIEAVKSFSRHKEVSRKLAIRVLKGEKNPSGGTEEERLGALAILGYSEVSRHLTLEEQVEVIVNSLGLIDWPPE